MKPKTPSRFDHRFVCYARNDPYSPNSNRHCTAKTHSPIGLRSVNFPCDRRLLCAMFVFAISHEDQPSKASSRSVWTLTGR